LRERLLSSDTELTAMTLALEAERKRAEETLTLLAAERLAAEAGTTERDAALAAAEAALLAEQDKALAAAREVELLNQQVAALRSQLGSLSQVLEEAEARDAAAKVQLESLGSDLNAALAQVASEQRRRAELEAAEAARLAAEAERLAEENRDLERFRSEFFGELSTLLAGREGVRVVGDRFVFSSEVLFNPGSADLAPEGRAQIASVVRTLDEVRQRIPPEIDWIIRVDGHTDNVPLSGGGTFADNWELSQGRALSVVRFMQDELGFPPERMAATGFGEYRPVATGDDEASRAQNRRIELKLTER
jgi:chemotaxis protein MotB